MPSDSCVLCDVLHHILRQGTLSSVGCRRCSSFLSLYTVDNHKSLISVNGCTLAVVGWLNLAVFRIFMVAKSILRPEYECAAR